MIFSSEPPTRLFCSTSILFATLIEIQPMLPGRVHQSNASSQEAAKQAAGQPAIPPPIRLASSPSRLPHTNKLPELRLPNPNAPLRSHPFHLKTLAHPTTSSNLLLSRYPENKSQFGRVISIFITIIIVAIACCYCCCCSLACCLLYPPPSSSLFIRSKSPDYPRIVFSSPTFT